MHPFQQVHSCYYVASVIVKKSFNFGQDVEFVCHLLHPCHHVVSSMLLLQRHGGQVRRLHLVMECQEIPRYDSVARLVHTSASSNISFTLEVRGDFS